MREHILVRVTFALFFAASFALIGWTAPVIYASNAPNSEFIEVHDFTAQNVSSDATSHYLCFNRTVNKAAPGQAYAELYIVNGDNERAEIDSKVIEQYFQKGQHQISYETPLPPNLEPGEYRYILVIQMDLTNGRVTRNFVFKSDSFFVGPKYASQEETRYYCDS